MTREANISPLTSAWHPMTDMVDKKTIGKLLEELGELSSAAARCLIQGIDGNEPVTGKPNKQWLEEEMADVYANMMLVGERFDLDWEFINARRNKKIAQLKGWHDMA